MTDVDTLLRQTADRLTHLGEPDVGADLERGRRELTRRRRRHAARGLAMGVVAAAAAVAVVGAPTNPAPAPPSGGTAAAKAVEGAASAPPMSAVALVTYQGTQPAGFIVDAVPAGWELQGVDQFALTIAAAGTTDSDPASYDDKLVVMLQSVDGDQRIPAGPAAVDVAGQPGHVDIFDDGYTVLTFDDGAGHVVVVQAAPDLRWGASQIVAFAAGVHVTPDATPAHG